MKITDLKGYATLYNGVQMPYLGLGVFKVSDGEEVMDAVKTALKVGYRSIDTAAVYRNENGVGEAVKESDIPREEIFMTTKLWNINQGYDRVFSAFDKSLARLGMDYVDLYLIHWPVKGKYLDSWRALEELYQSGKARAIGVCNFLQHHLEDVLSHCNIKPMVNQIEYHPYLTQPQLIKFCIDHDIRPEAWSPLMQGHVTEVNVLNDIGKKYGKSAVQVVLRWDLQNGVITLPKSVHPDRIKDNADIFDFSLTPEEMETIDNLNQGFRFGPDPDNFNF
ncbi:MAG: aldo/keto reductase [Candidatus Azobacteroides sp.]|nr:aldo/keto reductase [Candidatus Azobacteroides sp.]